MKIVFSSVWEIVIRIRRISSFCHVVHIIALCFVRFVRGTCSSCSASICLFVFIWKLGNHSLRFFSFTCIQFEAKAVVIDSKLVVKIVCLPNRFEKNSTFLKLRMEFKNHVSCTTGYCVFMNNISKVYPCIHLRTQKCMRKSTRFECKFQPRTSKSIETNALCYNSFSLK